MAHRRLRRILAVAVLLAAALAASRAGADTPTDCSAGMHALQLGGGSTSLVHVTPALAGTARTLLLVLHDTGGTPGEALATFRAGSSPPGLVLVAPRSRGRAWSFERGRGNDLATVSRALTRTVSHCAVDSRRIGIGGFGAGATAALSLGITNGRLFRSIVAFAPGPIGMQRRVGRPRVFIAHGEADSVSSFARTKDALVPALRRSGYAVTFRAFPGGHVVPAAVARAAVRWFLS